MRMVTQQQKAKLVRCAVYTRKSTEDGLEQDFNSLDAQREACEAYIASQKHEGWVCLPHHYDDGGFSGGTLDRPALQRLIEDIRVGKIDLILVYKVDRLSRSLLDFAKLVELLEGQGVSFVSITQNFSTNTAMGKLTLNILLSFAEFERAIISERVRDKIAGAKRKGKFTGGTPVLGYDIDPDTHGLVVNPEEAKVVRWIFRRYTEIASGLAIAKDLNARGITTKSLNARMRADEVVAITALWADIDIAGPAHQGGKKYPPDRAAVKAILDASGFDPTVIVNSGHGIHVYLCLEEPWVFTDESDRGEALTLVQAYQQRLKDSAGQMGYDIDSTFDLARVLRVPGTINFKVPEKPVPVTLLGLSPRLRYSVAELKSLLMNTDEPLSAGSTRVRLQLADGGQEAKTPSTAGDAKADILPKLMKLMDDEEFRETWFDRRDSFKSRSEQDFALAMMALRHGWRDEEVSELLFSHRRNYPVEEGRVDPKLSRPDYFQRTVSAARAHLDRRTEQRDIEELREEAEAIVQSVRGGDLYPSEEERQVLMEYLSSVFRVRIKEMVKYESEVPTYVFTFGSGKEMEITKVRQLMSQSEFGTRLLAAVGDTPERMSTQTWHTICLIMIKAFRVERDWTGGKLRRFEELIRDYIDSADVSDDLREALDYRCLFRGPDKNLYLYKDSLLKWAMDRRSQRISDSDAGAALKRLGFLSEEKHQRRVKRNLWRLPPDFAPSGDAPDG